MDIQGYPKYIVGDVVTFIDREGRNHNALVTHSWESCLNIAYVGKAIDAYGNILVKESSVPYKQEGMNGYYIR